MKLHSLKSLAALALTLTAPWASAGLLGSQATVGYQFLGTTYTDSLLVGAGIEVSCPGSFAMCRPLSAPTQTVDLGDSYLAYNYTSANGNPAGFNDVTPSYFIFDNLLPGGDIAGFTLTTDIAGLDSTRVNFTVNSVHVDMHGLALGTRGSFRIDLATAQAVPEPASAALAVLALGGLAFARRRR